MAPLFPLKKSFTIYFNGMNILDVSSKLQKKISENDTYASWCSGTCPYYLHYLTNYLIVGVYM